jgi:hypothetical protein
MMNGTTQNQIKPGRKLLLAGAGLLAVLFITGFFVFKLLMPQPIELGTGQGVSAVTMEGKTEQVPVATPPPQVLAPRSRAPASPVISPVPRTANQIMAELGELSGAPGPITAERAEKIKQALAELLNQGATAVPAIREFLEKNLESDYLDLEGGEQLGYSSLRASLLDTLKQIGGPEAREAMLATLQTSAMPSELLELSKDLELESPGQYREEILNAAREALTLASANKLGTNVELGPAFRVLQNYSEINSVDDLARNDPAKFSQAVAMANLPDGQGLPALIKMAEDSAGGSQTVATEMIAQLAGENSQALEALTKMAQKGLLSNGDWMRISPILAGDQYQIGGGTGPGSGGGDNTAGNDNYSIVNNVTTREQVNQRIALIDKLIGFVEQDSAAAASLQRERGVLMAKLGK